MADPSSTGDPAPSRAPRAIVAVVLFTASLALRLLIARWQYFWEQDDISIAAGVASLVRGETPCLYRYGPQIGYYRLLHAADLLLGGDPNLVPRLMVGVSAVSGALIPVLGLYAYRSRLEYRTRLLLALFLFVNPILWASSQYGNSAMPAVACVCAAMTMLSNRPRGAKEAAALGLFAAAVLIRADSILVAPAAAVLLHRTHGSLRAVALRASGVAALLAAVYGVALAFDARMDDVVSTTAAHIFNGAFRTKFWEYLLWSISPFVLLLAAWGWRDLLERRDSLVVDVTLWCVPVFAFYFGSTTTPRYCLLEVFPISICSVHGANRLADTLSGFVSRRWVATAAVLALACVHMVVGLGQFVPDRLANMVINASIFTHDGELFTGGFLYHAAGSVRTTLRHPPFGSDVPFAKAIDAALTSMADPATGPRRIVFVCDGYPSEAFRYHAMVRGAKVVRRVPAPDDTRPTWYRIGDTTIMAVGRGTRDLDALDSLEVGPGDEFWNMQDAIPPQALSRFPGAVRAVPIEGPGGGVRAYRFVGRMADEHR